MSFEKNTAEVNALFEIIEECVIGQADLDYLRCVKGDFILYHGMYSKLQPFRFLLHFIKSLMYPKRYEISYIPDENVSDEAKSYEIATVLTADHLYEDNLKPLVDRLGKKKVKNTFLRIGYKGKLNLSWPSGSLPISVFMLLIKKKINTREILAVMYLKYVLIPNCKRLANYIRKTFVNNYSLILSTETCDIFSRVYALVAKENNVEFILFQCGPLYRERNLEIWSIISDYYLAWPEARAVFDKFPLSSDVETQYFFPPRFYSVHNGKKINKYDVAVFLPWLNYSSPMKSIKSQIELTLKSIEKKKLKVCIKLHPHTDESLQSYILEKYKRFNFFPKVSNSNELILSSKMVVTFGSTVCYDADYMQIKTAIINLDNRLNNDHTFFKLKRVMNITTIEDLNSFLETFNPKKPVKKINFEALEFVYQRIVTGNT